MQNTANYKFKKPENTDLYNVQDFSDNMDAIDTALKALEDGTTPVGNALKLNGLTAEEFVSNENLLINSDFKNPVNSSGKTEWTTGYTVDKWHLNYISSTYTATLSDVGLTLARTVVGKGTCIFTQVVNGISMLAGKNITISFKVNGQVYKYTQVLVENVVDISLDTEGITFGSSAYSDITKNAGEDKIAIRFIMANDTAYTLEWVKLEVGKQATPFVPPNKEVEKLKCGVANADTIDGLHASAFLKTTSTGAIAVNSAIPFTTTNTGSDVNVTAYRGASGALGHLGFSSVDNPVFMKAEGGYRPLLHSDNYKSYALPLDGSVPMSGAFSLKGGYGRLNAANNWMALQSWQATDGTFKNGRYMQINNALYTGAETVANALQLRDMKDGKESVYTVLHTGNSAKVVVSSTPLTAEGSIRVW